LREVFVTGLIREILGPRDGIHEILDVSPLNEYITGVLAPVICRAGRDIESEAEIPVEDVEEPEEEYADVDVSIPPLLSPALDPKSRPTSMGLSFVVEAPTTPRIRVCLTWARYITVTGYSSIRWRRQPRYAVLPITLERDYVIYVDQRGRIVDDEQQAEISLHVIVRPMQNNHHLVTLYMVNRVRPPAGSVTAEHHIFQPQIRVKCDEGCRVVEGVRKIPEGEEERMLEFIYSNRPVLARGHLCSAIWRDIDPENQPVREIQLDFPHCRDEPPFTWPDGELLPPEDRIAFSPPDVRTEFVPMYSIPSPELEWQNQYGPAPELSAGSLAEIWNPDELRNALSPLADGYERWINRMENGLNTLPVPKQDIAKKIICDCRTVLNRIRDGIDILCRDDEARLAFCFANKAVDIQSRWSPRKEGLRWYPFQLAFILMSIESIINPSSRYRSVCDLLWMPTGSGKTEAYLAIIAFTIAYRRRVALRKRGAGSDRTGAGVSVITRYTLRLLTIQQFRRALALITACELLRVKNLGGGNSVGWMPEGYQGGDDFLWGSTPFRIGLWVGGNVTPNRLQDSWNGALSILKGQTDQNGGEPAQILNCPACGAILAIPEMGLRPGSHTLYFVVRIQNCTNIPAIVSGLSGQSVQNITTITGVDVVLHHAGDYRTLAVHIQARGILNSENIDDIWNHIRYHFDRNGCRVELIPVRASRPGYFMRYYIGGRGRRKDYDFEIFCPDPRCELRTAWHGGEPAGWIHGTATGSGAGTPGPEKELPDGNRFIRVQEAFMLNDPFTSDRIPIPALTVDEQLYSRLPAVIVATVDKFARLAFEPHAASFFGNVEYHHHISGYSRQQPEKGTYRRITQLDPPDLILQDELHLIEGPLGSLVGIYETAVDFLCRERRGCPIKYIASTATIRRAEEQVRAIFVRGLQVFPPPGFTVNDRFFLTESEIHALEDGMAGRLYVGVCALGRGPLTPIVRIWARLLQIAYDHCGHPSIDTFWTLTGYFNAVRELAGARALYRQDIPQRIDQIARANARPVDDESAVELSSRTSSTDLPAVLDILTRQVPDAVDALFTTSMFGTGIDIGRIGLMVVHGQPKTTSAYIQSTGRVGRRRGALVVTFYRASRPRDLSHYEFFCGYHRQLHRFVEPVTVYPFAPSVLQRATGPVCVLILRNMGNAQVPWWRENTAPLMASQRTRAQEVVDLSDHFRLRADDQPQLRRPVAGTVAQHVNSELDRWQAVASLRQDLQYVEYAINRRPQHPVVLGDSQHQHAGLPVVYENAPQSLREIEETTGFQTSDRRYQR
jgi:hypothetical protein